MLLDDGSALVEELVAEVRRHEPRGVHLNLVAHAAQNRGFMTLRAGISVEQRSEAVFRFEDPLEHLFPFLEAGALLWRKAGEGLAQRGGGRRLASAKGQHQKQYGCDVVRVPTLPPFMSLPLGW